MPTLGRAFRSPEGIFRSIALDPFRHLRMIFLPQGEDSTLVRFLDTQRATGTYEGFDEAG